MRVIEEIITDAALIGDAHVTGRLSRFDYILDNMLFNTAGNIVEIGAGHGDSTRIFLKHAREYRRNVLVIDPFEDGWNEMPDGYGTPYPYAKFCENVKGYENELCLFRIKSGTMLIDTIYGNNLPIAFAFVDGLQYADAVYKDLCQLARINTEVICVDDINRVSDVSQVPQAVDLFLKENNSYKLITLPRENIEGYLIRVK